MNPSEYLRKSYGRFVVPELDGFFRAEIIEFPGCIALGDTAAAALTNLEDVAASWLEATIAKGQSVPEPIENVRFSGKLVLRLPKSLHKKATHQAAREGVSLNQFIVSSVAEQVGIRSSSYTRAQHFSLVHTPANVFTLSIAAVFADTPQDLRASKQRVYASSGSQVGFLSDLVSESSDARS